jgi:hypothetical protein
VKYPFEDILKLLRKQWAGQILKTRLLKLLHYNSLYVVLIISAESIWYFSSTVRWILLLPFIANIILFLWIRDYYRKCQLHRYPEINNQLMDKLGREIDTVQDHLINAWQLSKNTDDLSLYAVQTFWNHTPYKHLVEHIHKRKNPEYYVLLRRNSIISAIVACVFILFLSQPANRLLTPGKEYAIPFPWSFQIEPGDAVIKEGDTLNISIRHNLPPVFPKYVQVYSQHRTEQFIPYQIHDSLSVVSIINPSSSFTYRFLIRRPHIFKPWKVRYSENFNVKVIKKPVPELLEFEVIPPEYAGLKREYYTGGTDRIHLLSGSVLKITGRLSHPAGLVTVQSSAQKKTLSVSGQNFHGSIIPRESGVLTLHAEDTAGVSLADDLIYRISVHRDEAPKVTVLIPDSLVLLNEIMSLQWMIYISDDYGIDKTALEYRTLRSFQIEADTNWNIISLPFNESLLNQALTDIWKIDERLSPGDEIEFRFMVQDNNSLSGPGVSRSSILKARYPSLTELFERRRTQHENSQGELENLQTITRELQEKAEEFRQDILKKGDTDWGEKETFENLIRQQQAVKEELSKIRENLEKQIHELSEQQIFSDEILDNMDYMQKLIRDLENSDIFRELQKMQEKIRRDPDANTLRDLAEQFGEYTRNFEESLERTIKLLETLRDLEALERGEKILSDLVREQHELLENHQQRQSHELAATEKDLSEKISSLQKELERSDKNLSEDLRDLLEEFSEFIKETDAKHNLEEASDAFSRNERQKGQEAAELSYEKMKEMLNQYREMGASFHQSGKEEILKEFHNILRRALIISEKQEALIPGTKNLSNDSPDLHTKSSLQNRIDSELDLIYQGLKTISQKTFFMGPAPFDQLENVKNTSKEIMNYLKDGRSFNAEQSMQKGLGQINELTATVFTLMGQAQSSESGTGMESFMEQLQAMAGMQQGINSETQSLAMPGPGNAGMDLMSELAARQQALRRQLSQLRQTMEQAGNGGSDQQLERIGKEMEEVINDLRKNSVSRRTLQRQQGIQQRLLDASRSIRTRDLSKERESRRGEQVIREGPEQLPKDLGSRESLIESIRIKLRDADLPVEDRREMEVYLEKLRESLK